MRRGRWEDRSVAGYRRTLDVLARLGEDERGTGRRRSATASLVAMERSAQHGRSVLLLVVALVLVVAGVGAFLAVRLQHGARSPKQASHQRSQAAAPTAPTTTLPSRYTAVSATASSATYAPVNATYSLLVGATASDCWMSVTSSTGTTVVAQTFAPGTTATVSLTGRATIVIGAPASAELQIGGIPLVLPSGATSPFTVTLLPS